MEKLKNWKNKYCWSQDWDAAGAGQNKNDNNFLNWALSIIRDLVFPGKKPKEIIESGGDDDIDTGADSGNKKDDGDVKVCRFFYIQRSHLILYRVGLMVILKLEKCKRMCLMIFLIQLMMIKLMKMILYLWYQLHLTSRYHIDRNLKFELSLLQCSTKKTFLLP